MSPEELLGKSYTFDDGNQIEIIQVKYREYEGETLPFVTYHISSPRSIPRKLVMPYNQFIDTYRHLFET